MPVLEYSYKREEGGVQIYERGPEDEKRVPSKSKISKKEESFTCNSLEDYRAHIAQIRKNR